MKKRLISLVLAAFIGITPMCVSADETVSRAKVLYDLGLLKGTGSSFSQEGLELTRNATRAEVCTTVVRMLGKENKANYQANAHPFTDVPQWAGNYIGWLYENYLVNGVSDTYFGAQDVATVQQFATMLLRVLGFSDAMGDFNYSGAVSFAQSYGLLTADMANRYELSRSDMINMCYNALRLNINNSNRKLIRKLCDEGAVAEYLAESTGILKPPSIADSFADVPATIGGISVSYSSGCHNIYFDEYVEEFGLRVFVCGEDGIVKEVSLANTEKGKISYLGGGSAGYIKELRVYGLDRSEKYSFIVVKTTSEDVLYNMVARSGVANN